MAWSGLKMERIWGAKTSMITMSPAATPMEIRMATWTTRLARSNFPAPKHWAITVVAAVYRARVDRRAMSLILAQMPLAAEASTP